MAGLHAAIDAARALLDEAPLDPKEVHAIEISMSEAAFHHGGWRAERPLTAVGAQMNVACAVAVTLLDGTALAAQFAPERIDADDVWRLIACTTARHEPAFDERYEDGYSTRLCIALSDGCERQAFVAHPRGGIVRPLTNDEVVDKFHVLTAALIDADRARAIERCVLDIRRLDDIGELQSLLAAPVHSHLKGADR
jgi:aconitate decarboxylase